MKRVLCGILSAIMAMSALTFAVPVTASAAVVQEDSSVGMGFEGTPVKYGSYMYVDDDNNTVMITDYTGKESTVTVPSKIKGKKVNRIWSFGPNKYVKNVILPNGLRYISMDPFVDCVNMKSITIPASAFEFTEWSHVGFLRGNQGWGSYKKIKDFTIKGYKGTEAESYAKEMGFKFIAIKDTVKLNRSSAAMGVGQKAALIASSAGDMKCSWTSSNSKAASVDKYGWVTAKAVGTATITAKASNGTKATCKITVKKAPASVKMSRTTATLGVGEKYTLTKTLSSGSAGSTSWATSNKKVVAVDKSGKLTAKGIGTATVTVKTYNGKKATCKVTVKKAPTSVKLNQTTINLKKNKTYTLKATLSSGSSSVKSWSSSNKKIAAVSSSGVVTAKAKGTATVTVKTYNGKTAKCKVVVK